MTAILLYAGASCTSQLDFMTPTAVSEANQGRVESRVGAGVQQTTKVLETEFEGLFAIDERTIWPTYLKGDFNGDGVEDLAVAVRLNRQIDPNDNSKPPFQFEKAQGPGPTTVGEPDYDEILTFTMGDLARYRDATMLAVIHGSAGGGLTRTEPQRRIVIVDAWYLGNKKMSLFRGKLRPARYGEPTIVPPPDLLGDAILMIGPEQSGTAVYWDGARYRWYEVPAPGK